MNGGGDESEGGGTRGPGEGLREDPFGKSSGSRGGGQEEEGKKARRVNGEESLTEGEGAARPDEAEEGARTKERPGSGTSRSEKCSKKFTSSWLQPLTHNTLS